MNGDQLKTAFETALKHFNAISGRSSRLALAECSPYKELKTWNLY
jgi:hypothetical protein